MEPDINIELSIASGSGVGGASGSSTPASSPRAQSSRSPRRTFRPAGKKKNPRWEGQTNVPVFDLLPDELIVRIHSELEVPTIGITAQCCKRFNEIANDMALWRDLEGRNGWKKPNARDNPITRSYYVRKFLSYRREEKRREDEQRAERLRLKRNDDIRRSSLAMLCLLFARPYEWVCTVAVILFTVFSALKLDGVITWSWPAVFVPMLVVCYQLFFTPCVYDILRHLYGCDFEDELAPEKTLRPIFFFLFFLMPLQSGRTVNRFLVFTPIVCIVTFVALYLIRLATSPGEIPWWAVFLPMFILAFYFSVLALVAHEPIWDDSKWIDHIIPFLGALLFILFVFLLVLKLEGTIDISWFSVMAPLFAMKALFTLAPLLLTFFSYFCCEFYLEDRSRWPSDPGPFCLAAAIAIALVLGPLLAFEIVLAQKLEHERDSSYAVVFVPLFLLEGFGVCACFALNLVVLFE